MIDIDKIAKTLPVPGRDPKPPAAGQLTDEQVKEIRANKPAPRRKWSNKAEQMMVRILEGAFGAANVKREADRLQGWQDENGDWNYNYANLGKPDITFAVVYQGKLWDGVMEVKSTTTDSLSVTEANIKPWQVRAMDKAKGKLRLWGLVFWGKDGQARCFVITHEHFMFIVNEELPRKAKGNYQGKSIRTRDMHLLTGCEVLKSNRWFLPGYHWFVKEQEWQEFIEADDEP